MLNFDADVITLFPFHIPIIVPRRIYNILLDGLSAIRFIPPRRSYSQDESALDDDVTPEDIDTGKIKEWRSIITLIVFVITSKSVHILLAGIYPC